jgi:hypothetical protein
MIRQKYRRCALLLLCGVMVASAGAAQDSAGAGVAVPQAQTPRGLHGYIGLPDWFGQWEIVGLTPGATGGFQQSLPEVMQGIQKWGPPPFNSRMRAVFEQAGTALAARAPNTGYTHPLCAFGFPMLMLNSPLMFEILATPKETVMVFSGREMRHIYTDGRPHTAKDDLWPTYWGDSIGHWDGQTLVIDTIEVNSPLAADVTPIVAFGGDANDPRLVAMLSPAAHFIEKIHMIDKDHLEDRMTIIDPVFFTAAWHIDRQYQRVAGMHRMVHEDCEGEDRNPIVNGEYTIAPPPTQSGAPR